jgi:hypothetical protein
MVTVYEKLDNRREVLTASGEVMPRSEAAALGYTVAPYAELVPASERIATTHAEHVDLVRVPPFGMLVTAATAKSAGFVVSQVEAPPRASMRENPRSSWRSAIMALPEARDRTSATAELLTTQSHETLSVEAARAMLRGLPVETTIEEDEPAMSTNEVNPERAARLAEISGVTKAFNKSRGYSEPRAAAAPNGGRPVNDVEPAKLKRLAEIRLNSLESNSAGEASANETKKLRYALQVHAETGMPLLNVFSQLGVDTSKLLR